MFVRDLGKQWPTSRGSHVANVVGDGLDVRVRASAPGSLPWSKHRALTPWGLRVLFSTTDGQGEGTSSGAPGCSQAQRPTYGANV